MISSASSISRHKSTTHSRARVTLHVGSDAAAHRERMESAVRLKSLLTRVLMASSHWAIWTLTDSRTSCNWPLEVNERKSLYCGMWHITWWRHQMETFSALPVDSPHNGQWRRASMFSLICAWTNGWANNRGAVGFRHHRAYFDTTVMQMWSNSYYLIMYPML